METGGKKRGKKFGLVETALAAAAGRERNGNNNMIFPREFEAGGIRSEAVAQEVAGGGETAKFERVNKRLDSRHAIA